MRTELEYVETFLWDKQLGIPGSVPQSISTKALIDRHHLLTEELSEYLQAGDSGNLVKILDALVDLQYLLLGTVVLHGMQGIFPEAFRRVHIANMNKLPGTNSKRILLSTDVIKPPEWTPAKLEDLVNDN